MDYIKKNFWTILGVVMTLFLFTFGAEAATFGGKSTGLIQKLGLIQYLKWGLYIVAAYQWIEFFLGFSPKDALKNIWLPAVLTLLATQLDTILKYLGIAI